MRQTPVIQFAAAALLGAAVATAALTCIHEASPVSPAPITPPQPISARPQVTVAPAAPVPAAAPSPAAHARAIHMDTDGEIVVDRTLRRFFDDHLTHLSRHTDDQVTDAVQRDMEEQAGVPATEKAMVVFRQYLAYRRAALAMEAGQSSAALMAPHAAALQVLRMENLRAQYLGTELNQAFFPDDKPANDMAVAQMEVMQDKSLSSEEKMQQMAALDAALKQFAEKKDAQARQEGDESDADSL